VETRIERGEKRFSFRDQRRRGMEECTISGCYLSKRWIEERVELVAGGGFESRKGNLGNHWRPGVLERRQMSRVQRDRPGIR